MAAFPATSALIKTLGEVWHSSPPPMKTNVRPQQLYSVLQSHKDNLIGGFFAAKDTLVPTPGEKASFLTSNVMKCRT